MKRLLEVIAIALAAFASSAPPFEHACREDSPYLGLGTGFRLDSISNSNSQGAFKAWSAYRYDDRGVPTLHVAIAGEESDTAFLTLGPGMELKSIASETTMTTVHLSSDFSIDSTIFENTVSKSRIRTSSRRLFGDTLAWEQYMFNPDQLVKALTIYSAEGRKEYLVGDSASHPLRNCIASGDTCSCASTLLDSSNTVPDLIYVYRNRLLEKVLSGTAGPGRSESRYHYHALDGSSLAKAGAKDRVGIPSRFYNANGRRVDLDDMLKGSGADPVRLRNRMYFIENPALPR